MAGKGTNIQDFFLNVARKESVPVTLHLVNGFQIKGIVKSFDNFTIILDSMGKQQMIYKHAVSTITPARPLNLSAPAEGEESEGEAAEVVPEPEPEPEKKPVKRTTKKVVTA